jgi:hypothetical protein
MKNLKIKWLLYAVGGILLMGFGLSLLGESIILKIEGTAFLSWFGLGTISLIIFFAGLSIFGQAIVYKCELHKNRHRKS